MSVIFALTDVYRKPSMEGYMRRFENIAIGLALLWSASPAFAGINPVPAPIAGVGIGAVVLVGLGYRALKGRIRQ